MPFGFFRKQQTIPALESCRLRRSPHVLATSQGDEMVLFDARGERYYTLNEVGSRVWTMLGDATTLDQIVASIHREYDVAERDAVALDVGLLLRDLHAAGLVHAEPQAAVRI